MSSMAARFNSTFCEDRWPIMGVPSASGGCGASRPIIRAGQSAAIIPKPGTPHRRTA